MGNIHSSIFTTQNNLPNIVHLHTMMWDLLHLLIDYFIYKTLGIFSIDILQPSLELEPNVLDFCFEEILRQELLLNLQTIFRSSRI